MLKVIEVAQELGVSKVTIYKKIDLFKSELRGHTKKQKGILYLDEVAKDIIKKSLVDNGVLRDVDDLSDINEKLLDQIKGAEDYLDFYQNEISKIRIDNIKDLELISDFLENQLSMKQSLLKQKDEQLKKYKEMIAINKARIRAIENVIQMVQETK